MSLPDPRIRAVALGLAVRSGHVLAESYAASPGRAAFLRALGGGIDFGETGAEALRREFREELGLEVVVGERLGVIENIFSYAGEPAHEVAQVFAVAGEGIDDWPLDERRPVLDSTQGTTAGWHRIDELATNATDFFPPGILDLAVGLSRLEG